MIGEAKNLTSSAARQITRELLSEYSGDARAMPLGQFRAALKVTGLDPLALAREFNTDLASVFRRLATLRPGILATEVGLVVCDASGSILFRKPIAGFAVPRFGATCPHWPLFTALSRPMVPIRRRVSQLGRTTASFDCLAIAWPVSMKEFGADPLYRSTMLILPEPAEAEPSDKIQIVGSNCRVCPSHACDARRAPSILSEGF